MKKYLTIVVVLTSLISKADYWIPKSNFLGAGSVNAICFSIGSKGYIGCGFDTANIQIAHKDFWEYDPTLNSWTQKADFGGLERHQAVSFSIGNLGYAGVGMSQFNGQLNDFWEYNPVNNIWIQKANFNGGARDGAIGFSIGNMGYVGMGEDYLNTLHNDLWQYDPVSDSWIQKTSCPGSVRTRANSFVIGNDAYIICGYFFLNDVWKYNSITDTWVQKNNFPSTPNYWAAAFSICGLGYYGTGIGGPFINSWWQYDPVNDTWIQKTNFMGTPRCGTSYFTIGVKGYVGLGNENYDFYEYTPDSTCITSIKEINKLSCKVFPNLFKSKLNVETFGNEQSEIILYDVKSNKILQQRFANSATLNTEQIAKGIYLYEVKCGSSLCKKGKLVKD